MITYKSVRSYYEAAAMASQDTENWTPEERRALAKIAALGEWHQEGQTLCDTHDPYSEEMKDWRGRQPGVYSGEHGSGRYFSVKDFS